MGELAALQRLHHHHIGALFGSVAHALETGLQILIQIVELDLGHVKGVGIHNRFKGG